MLGRMWDKILIEVPAERIMRRDHRREKRRPNKQQDRCAGIKPTLLAIGDPWIDEFVNNVSEKIHQNIRNRDDQHTALHERIVAGLDRLNGQAAEARPTKDRFRDQRAGQQLPNAGS